MHITITHVYTGNEEQFSGSHAHVADQIAERYPHVATLKNNLGRMLDALSTTGALQIEVKDPRDGDEDEVRRLLQHPNRAERLMALKLGGVSTQHLIEALRHLDPEVVRAAMRHPQFDDHALLALMHMPNRGAAQLEALHTHPVQQHHIDALLDTITRHPVPEYRELVSAIGRHGMRSDDTFKSEASEFLARLEKATDPDHFRSIVKATDPAGATLVDHRTDLQAHPPDHSQHVEEYHQHIRDSHQPVKPLKGGSKFGAGGITRKLIYKSPSGSKFMVKPYHERVVRRVKEWMRHPHQGWAEMTNQALYHAANIGHLHQKVFTVEHDMNHADTGLKQGEPALVVKLDHGFQPVQEGVPAVLPAETHLDAKRIALMDFLTNNLDRHGGNLLINPDDGRLLAVDHSRSFQYVSNHHDRNKRWANQAEVAGLALRSKYRKPSNLEDSFRYYHNDTALDRVDPFPDWYHPVSHRKLTQAEQHDRLRDFAEQYDPAFEWWGQNSAKVRETMGRRLQAIKDPAIRDHIKRNFDERADYLDERAKFGIDNYGHDWFDYKLPHYRPGEMTDQEREHHQWEQEQRAQGWEKDPITGEWKQRAV